jgi:hypothetical protein
MKRMNREEAIKKTLTLIDDMEAVNKVLPEVKKVIAAWDGKVLNKRIEKDLEALGLPGHIYFTTRYENTYEINYRPEKGNDWYTILSGSRPTCQYYTKENSFVDPDKRISAERAFMKIEAGRVERLQRITSYRDHLTTWEAKKAQMEILKKQLKTIADSVPYGLRDYFGMRVSNY